MKKIIYLFLILSLLVVGVMMSSPNGKSEATDIQDKIDEFEEKLKDPDYINDTKKTEKIKPNFSNEIAKGGEKVINSIFDIGLDILNGFLNK